LNFDNSNVDIAVAEPAHHKIKTLPYRFTDQEDALIHIQAVLIIAEPFQSFSKRGIFVVETSPPLSFPK
jgi:hypothetical protein